MNVPASRVARGVATVAFLLVASTARADLLTFDDLPGFQTPVPDGYGGLNWGNFADVAGALGTGGFPRGVVSGPNVAYNVGGAPATISAVPGSVFGLDGGYFTAAATDGLTIEAVGYRLGNPVAGDDLTFSVATSGPILVSLPFTNVDRLTFTATGGADTRFVLDNLSIRTVPEPSALALIMIGAVALAARRHHARKNPHKFSAPRDR